MDRALALAYGYIGKRERTTAEVRTRLEAKEISPPAAEVAIDELTQLGALDDARFVRLFTEDKRNLEGWGTERIVRALIDRGIDREMVAEVVAGEPDESELDRAVAVLHRRFPEPPADLHEQERALGVLVRKGYDTETAYDAVRMWAAVR